MLSFKLIGTFAIAIACAQMVALDVADARRGGGGSGGMRAGGGFGGGAGMRGGGYGGGMRVGSPRVPHASHPIARPGVGRPGGPGWAGGPGVRPGWSNRPGYGYRPGYGWGAAAVGAGLAYSAYNSGYYGDGYYGAYDEGSYAAPAEVAYESDAIAECARRFKSYDPASQTYVVRKGQRASCP